MATPIVYTLTKSIFKVSFPATSTSKTSVIGVAKIRVNFTRNLFIVNVLLSGVRYR